MRTPPGDGRGPGAAIIRLVSEPAPDAPDLDPNDAKIDELFWTPLRFTLDLDPAQWTNLTRVVGLHVVLDRLLTLTILNRLGAGETVRGLVATTPGAVAGMKFERRLKVVEEAEWVAAEAVADLREVNRVRNRLLHFDPRRKLFEEVPEIRTAATFREFTRRGHLAFMGLAGPLMPLLERAAEEP